MLKQAKLSNHINFTEYPVVVFLAVIEELPLISLALGISSLNKFNNNNNNTEDFERVFGFVMSLHY